MNQKNLYDELLEKLISGTINPEERYQLEKKALDDPMLFDAIEGIAIVPGEPHFQHIEAIKSRINESLRKKKKRIMLFPFAAAASIALLFFLGNWLYNPDKTSDTNEPMVINQNEIVPTPMKEKEVNAEPASDSEIASVDGNDIPTLKETQKPPPPESIVQNVQEPKEEISEDMAIVPEEQKIDIENIETRNVEDQRTQPAVLDRDIVGRTSSSAPLSSNRSIKVDKIKIEDSQAMSNFLPAEKPTLDSFIKENYSRKYDELPTGIRVNFEITLNKSNVVEKVQIIDGDSLIGSRIVPFIKQYRDWKVQKLPSIREIQFLFISDQK